MEFELPLDVCEQRGGTDAEKVGLHPLITQFLFHQRQPDNRLFGGADAPSRLEPDLLSGALVVISIARTPPANNASESGNTCPRDCARTTAMMPGSVSAAITSDLSRIV